MKIGGLILAGGLSRRLGRPKQMLQYGDGTLLDHVVAEVEAVVELDPLVVVLPPGDAVAEPRTTRAHITRRQREGGCSASLQAGLSFLPELIDAVCVLPSDQPGLSHDLISLAVHCWSRTRPPALTLSFHGQPGHPLVFSAALRPQLNRLEGEKGMWRLLEHLEARVERVEVNADPLQDVDTWEDYRRVIGPA